MATPVGGAPSVSETTTIEYNRWLVENSAKQEAEARKMTHDEERKMRQMMQEKYRNAGNLKSAELKEQLVQAKKEVAAYRDDNLRRGMEVKEEVDMLRKAPTQRLIKWCNKPTQTDPCVATLTHEAEVTALAISNTLLVGGSGKFAFVYDLTTEELLQKLEGTSGVQSVAIFEKSNADNEDERAGLIAVAYENGTLKIWDAGVSTDTCQNLAQSKIYESGCRLCFRSIISASEPAPAANWHRIYSWSG